MVLCNSLIFYNLTSYPKSLKTFNSEKVVEAVIGSKFPVITGIGHENDETFVGMSADFNCSTPSIVATFLSQNREKILNDCLDLNQKLNQTEEKFLNQYENRIFNFLNNLSYKVEKIFSLFNNFERKLRFLLNEKIFQINNLVQKGDTLARQLIAKTDNCLQIRENSVSFFETKIDFLNPKNILKKGFGIIYSQSGKVLDSIKKIKRGDRIKIQLEDGKLKAKIE
jgi:exodeoxyribonuclease VII large subunit